MGERTNRAALVAVAGLVVVASACAHSTVAGDVDTGDAVIRPAGRARAVYEEFADCAELVAWTKEQLLDRVTAYGLSAGPGYWEENGAATGTTAAGTTQGGPDGAPGAAPRDATAGTVPSDVSSSPDTSGTNTQEVGVDEGDLAETDGRYVYSIIDDHLRSVDLPAGRLLDDITLPQVGEHQMILDGPTLLVVSDDGPWGGEAIARHYRVDSGRLTLGATDHLEGRLLGVRSVDGVARLTMSASLVTRLPFVQPRDGDEQSQRTALEKNRAVVRALTSDDLLPRRYERGPKGTTTAPAPAVDCSRIGHPSEFSGFGLTWVATVPLESATDGSGATGVAGIVADGDTVYSSLATLYVATHRLADAGGDVIPVRPDATETSIHAFDLSDPNAASYTASGVVPGYVLSSYSMSELDGYLRVATTTDQGGFGQSRESGVHVMRREGAQLIEVGAVTGLGADEQIQGVRFDGDRGYVVTFRRTDPIFVLDLHDPAAPTLEGELKIPGFSSYLHPIGDGLLLGVGPSGTESGILTGTQLSLFDVHDPAKPALLATLPIGQNSEAATDPHAFLWWPATHQVVVPRELVCAKRADCASAIVATVAGRALVRDGGIFHCYPIRRSMVVGGRLVTISAGGVRVHDLATLAQQEQIDFDMPDCSGMLPPE
jgi:hypothetical protein